jgi:integral membrane protein
MTLARSLLLYRVLAYIVGVMLIIVFCAIPFSSVEQVVGPIHGVLYLVYLAAALNLVIRARLGLWTLVAMVTAGWVPFVAFVVERWVTPRVRAGASLP